MKYQLPIHSYQHSSRPVGAERLVNCFAEQAPPEGKSPVAVVMKFSDTTGGFKCWRAETLRAIGLDRVFSNGYLFQVEMTYRTFRRGFKVAEIPIIFYERNLGRSKMHWRIIWEALWGVLRLRITG